MKRILIVDDEPDHRLILRTMLEGRGYICEEAHDGVMAQEKLQATSIDLVLTDLNMPRMNGLQLIEYLAKSQDFNATPIILVTNQIPNIRPSFGSKGNLVAILPKPYEWQRLLAVVTTTIESSHREPSLAV